jgi:MYND finger
MSFNKITSIKQNQSIQYNLPNTMKSSYTVIRNETNNINRSKMTSPINSCSYCKKQSEILKQCANCINVFYCSRECQVSDWKYHKTECTDIFFADMFQTFETIQCEDCKTSLPVNKKSKEFMRLPSDMNQHIKETYSNLLTYFFKIISLLKNYYKDGHNPYLKKDSPYICPVGHNHIQTMYIGEVFGVILYQGSSDRSKSCQGNRTLPDMCYVDYDAISSFLTYYTLESTRFNELVSELTVKLSTEKERKQLEDIYVAIKEVTTIVKRSKEFVLQCLQKDLKGVHVYKVIPNAGHHDLSKTHNKLDEFNIPVTIAIQETPQELIQKLKLDPKHLPYHILIRAKTSSITVEKLPSFHDSFMKLIAEKLT